MDKIGGEVNLPSCPLWLQANIPVLLSGYKQDGQGDDFPAPFPPLDETGFFVCICSMNRGTIDANLDEVDGTSPQYSVGVRTFPGLDLMGSCRTIPTPTLYRGWSHQPNL